MIDRIATALSRRKVLMGLAVSAAAAASAAEATGSAAEAPKENPELVALADQLPYVLGQYREAKKKVADIVAEWSPHWPVPSEEIYNSSGELYRSIEGFGIKRPWGVKGLMRVPHIGRPEFFEAAATQYDREAATYKRGAKQRLAWANQSRASAELARAHWAEVERITQASGIKLAKDRKTATRDALENHVNAIMHADDWTMTGAVIKAQAMQAWGEVEALHRAFKWPPMLAASILKHSEAAA